MSLPLGWGTIFRLTRTTSVWALGRAWSVFLLIAVAGVAPAHANMIITPTFDASIANDANVAAIETAINQAILVYQGLFTNNVNVQIYFQSFTSNSGLGESDVGRVYTPTYQTFYDALVANDGNPTAIASLPDAGAPGSTDPVLGQPDIDVKSANMRALGLSGSGLCIVTAGDTTPGTNVPNHCGAVQTGSLPVVDGIITLNTNITSPPNALSGNYSLQSVAEHEIDEVLGLGSSLPNTNSSSGTVSNARIEPEDLWRYNSSGQRVFTVNCANPGSAFFSVDGSGSGQQFNNACNGEDFGDWQSSGSPQVQDAVGTAGVNITLGPNEIAALTAIGYDEVPEPATIGLMFSALGLGYFLRRRLNLAK